MIELIARHAMLLAVATLLSLLLRKRSAALRHALWSATLALLLLLPLLQRVPITLPEIFSRSVAATEDIEKEESRAHIEGTLVERTAPAVTTEPQTTSRSLPWGTIALGGYAAVAIALIARWGIGWALAARLARKATPLGTARGVPVLAADGVGPLTFGWPRGVILVPHQRFALEKLVLRHEVAHVKRADFLWQGLGMLACALWWWSPFVWLAARQLRREAERACDDYVLNQGVSAPDYADCLLEVAAMKPLSLPFAASLVQGELAARVTALLATGKDRRPAAPLAVLGLTALLVPVGLTLTRPVAADVPSAPKVVPPIVAPKPAPRLVRVKTSVPQVIAPTPAKVAPKIVAPKGVAPLAKKLAPVVVDPVIAPAKLAPPARNAEPRIAPEPEADPTIAPDGRLAPSALEASPTIAPPIAPDGRVLDPTALKPEVVAPNGIVPQVVDPVKLPVKTSDDAIVASGSLVGKRIVLDPGHGGNDHGAKNDPDKAVPMLKDLPIIGGLFVPSKVSEKDFNLAIALNAAQRLRKEGAIVTLTRDSDTFVPLGKRSEFSAGQDLYLSIHIDFGGTDAAIQDDKRFPISVWFHGGETDTIAPTAVKLLTGISSPFSNNSSSRVNTNINRNVAGEIKSVGIGIEPAGLRGRVASDRKVFSSGFAVLRNAKCPAYLIDFGNMNRPEDVMRLRDSAFQNKLAQGIVDGAKAIL